MIILYQYQSCPFCCKVRALLNFIKLPYEIVEVTPPKNKELSFTDHKKVPVLKDVDAEGNEKVIVESATIIEYINEHYAKLPVTDEDKKWTDWVDQTLVHYLPPLIYPDFKTSRRNFKTILQSGQLGWLKRTLVGFGGSLVMPRVARKMKEKHGIVNVEAEFLDAIDHWVNKGLKNRAFYGGEQPSFVDCSVFGVLSSGHQLGVVKRAMHHSKGFALWYNKCYPLMTKT